MNEQLYPMIYKRKSFHLFRGVGSGKLGEEDLADIRETYRQLRPLDPDIRTAIRIVPAKETTWRAGEQYCILFYSETKGNYLQNIGYLGEQLDLYLVSRNIGTLWCGIGKTEETSYEGLRFVIMIAIAKVDESEKFRRDMFRSKRKAIDEIWTGEPIGGVTEIARFAPSACNSQPWLVKNEGALSVYRVKKPGKIGIMPAEAAAYFNRIDMGIFLCFLELCLEHEGRRFEKELYPDDGREGQILNAVYRLS